MNHNAKNIIKKSRENDLTNDLKINQTQVISDTDKQENFYIEEENSMKMLDSFSEDLKTNKEKQIYQFLKDHKGVYLPNFE